MPEQTTKERRLSLEAMDPRISSIQPGGGLCMALELAWGSIRRWYLKTFRRGYIERMAARRHGTGTGCPHEVLDPRDLKFHRNQSRDGWSPGDDPFTWRDRLPVARVGLAELVLGGTFCLAGAVALALVFWPLALLPTVLAGLLIFFFRDPRRVVPSGPGLVVAPADGVVVAIEEIPHDPFVDGPAVVIGIFLSVFNVHINRAPLAARVIGIHYRPGKFLNALRPRSAQENERISVRLEEAAAPFRRLVVHQIAGAIARRIVCWVKPGDELRQGDQFGMIKLGSRTELVLPREEGLVVKARTGQKVKAGTSVLAQFATFQSTDEHATTQN